jgi:nucleolar protein 6
MAAEKLNKKQKKANEFRNKKRKLDDSIADVPEEDNSNTNDDVKESKEDKKKEKKEASKESEDGATADGRKKRRRGKGAAKEEAPAAAGAEGAEAKEGAAAAKAAPKNHKFIVFVGKRALSGSSGSTDLVAKTRCDKLLTVCLFIHDCVGNLPYNITKEQLEKHFESCGMCSGRSHGLCGDVDTCQRRLQDFFLTTTSTFDVSSCRQDFICKNPD